MQRGVAKGLKVPCLFMITEVSIRCQKNPEVGILRIPAYTPPPIHHCLSPSTLIVLSCQVRDVATHARQVPGHAARLRRETVLLRRADRRVFLRPRPGAVPCRAGVLPHRQTTLPQTGATGRYLYKSVQDRGARASVQRPNDGVAAASSDGGPLVVGGPPTVLFYFKSEGRGPDLRK